MRPASVGNSAFTRSGSVTARLEQRHDYTGNVESHAVREHSATQLAPISGLAQSARPAQACRVACLVASGCDGRLALRKVADLPNDQVADSRRRTNAGGDGGYATDPIAWRVIPGSGFHRNLSTSCVIAGVGRYLSVADQNPS